MRSSWTFIPPNTRTSEPRPSGSGAFNPNQYPVYHPTAPLPDGRGSVLLRGNLHGSIAAFQNDVTNKSLGLSNRDN